MTCSCVFCGTAPAGEVFDKYPGWRAWMPLERPDPERIAWRRRFWAAVLPI